MCDDWEDSEPEPSWLSKIGWIVLWVLTIALAAAGGGLLANAILWWATN